MYRFCEKIFLACLIVLCAAASANAQENLRVLVYGDSLTSGYQLRANESYATRLDQKLREIGYTNVEVINMSMPGLLTARAAESVGDVLAKRPDIVVVQLGTNDVLRGVSNDIIYNNLVDILGKLQQRRIYIILLGIRAPESTDPQYARQLEAVFSRLVRFYRIPHTPNILEGIMGNPALSLADGYHPNGKGIDLMVDNTYLMVDTGLRWKWKTLHDAANYGEPTGKALAPAMPYAVDPPALPPGFGAR